uniref:Uncharacterized protein n=1 Tax=Phasianus colchicus TaxID=9054 RepID=A0A669PI87_PHACC
QRVGGEGCPHTPPTGGSHGAMENYLSSCVCAGLPAADAAHGKTYARLLPLLVLNMNSVSKYIKAYAPRLALTILLHCHRHVVPSGPLVPEGLGPLAGEDLSISLAVE